MKLKKMFERVMGTIVSCCIVLNCGLVSSLSTNAVTRIVDEENGYDIESEASDITEMVEEAVQQYSTEGTTSLSPAAKYHVLFVKCESVSKTGINGGNPYTFTTEKTAVLNAAITNFEKTVENFANDNVNIVTKVKTITNTINLDSNALDISYSTISNYLKDLAPYGYYDTVIVTSAFPYDSSSGYLYLGNTSKCAFDSETGYGYAYVSIPDSSVPSGSFPNNEPYMLTTNVILHEWLHTLESYRTIPLNTGSGYVEYPYTHGYKDANGTIPYPRSGFSDRDDADDKDYIDDFWSRSDDFNWNLISDIPYMEDMSLASTENAILNRDEMYTATSQNYSWPKYYPVSTSPAVVEPFLTSFYKAVLSANVLTANNKKIGMYPYFWEITPRKMYIGTYMIQSGGDYIYNNNLALNTSATISNSKSYQWNLIYRVEAKRISIMSNKDFGKYFDIINASINNNLQLYGKCAPAYNHAQTFNFIKQSSNLYRVQAVSPPFDSGNYLRKNGSNIKFSTATPITNWEFINITLLDGEYKIKNYTTGLYLAYDTSVTGNLSLQSNSSSDNQKWRIKYDLDQNVDGFYTIKPKNNSNLYLNVTNNSDSNGTVISLYQGTGIHSAQTWRTRLSAGNRVNIYPNVSTTRMLTYYGNGFKLYTLNSSYNQEWVLEMIVEDPDN